MSYDFLAQRSQDAAIIENLNRLRHYLMGRLTWEAVKEELEAFNNSFDEIDIEKLSSIIVSQMLFVSSERNNLAFEFSNALNSYLVVTQPELVKREELYNQFRDIAQNLLSSPQRSHGLPQSSRDLILDFLKTSIYSIAAKDDTDDLDSSLNMVGL